MSDTEAPTRDTSMEVAVRVRNAALKKAVGDLRSERDAFKAEADQYRKDNAELKAKWNESALVKRAEVAESRLKEVEFRKVFERIAKAKGIREDAVDVLYKYGEFKPNGETIDEAALESQIDEQKSKLTFLAASKDTTPAKPETKVAPGSGQGAKSGSGGAGVFQLPADDDPRWSDNMWLWNTRHQRAEAYKEKQAQGIV